MGTDQELWSIPIKLMAIAWRLLQSRVRAIESDRALCCFGASLALINAATAVYWLIGFPFSELFAVGVAPVCWPFIEGCEQFRIPSPQVARTVLMLLLSLSIWNALWFVRGSIPIAYAAVLGLSALKYLLVLQDFRLTLNHHYMAGWILAAFLFAYDKRRTIRGLLVAMYVWAGVLKLDPTVGWWSGEALAGGRPLGLPQAWIPAACAYVVVLELVVVWGLLSWRSIVFWAALCQLVLFHVASWWVVGFFYPVVMFLLLTAAVLMRATDQRPAAGNSVHAKGHRVGLRPGAAWVVALSLLQLWRFTFPGQSAVTGEGRVFALNMFDAPVECQATAIARPTKSSTPIALEVVPPLAINRVRCDPIVYLGLIKSYCRDSPGELDFRLQSRISKAAPFRDVVALEGVCGRGLSYSVLFHNWWILDD